VKLAHEAGNPIAFHARDATWVEERAIRVGRRQVARRNLGNLGKR
jgi:hypothetical protein